MKTPKILNILGLAVAIAAFMVVAMVRYYDLRYTLETNFQPYRTRRGFDD